MEMGQKDSAVSVIDLQELNTSVMPRWVGSSIGCAANVTRCCFAGFGAREGRDFG